MKQKTVGVIFGGQSSEHEVSLISAKSILDHLPKEQYNIVMIGISKQGAWYCYTGDPEEIPGGGWEQGEKTPAVISPDPQTHGLLLPDGSGQRVIELDVVFPALHGRNGEDGAVQGLLQLAGIPYVGCDLLSSAVCMDKAVTNTVCDAKGIAQAKWMQIDQSNYLGREDEVCRLAEETLSFPIFVKPANAGSSVGISKASDRASLREAISLAFVHDRKLVLEEGIDGQEVECAVLGNDTPIASTIGEIVPCNEFYDYEAKYLAGTTELLIPAALSEEKQREVQREALRAYRALGCCGLARVDFFVRRSDGRVLLNEVNTLPGFTSISMYPKLFEASGIPYSELLHRLILLALERAGV